VATTARFVPSSWITWKVLMVTRWLLSASSMWAATLMVLSDSAV
jgi:hypothetical protein